MAPMTTNHPIDILDADALSAPPTGGVGLTLMMPTERAGREVRENPIRLRNLLDVAFEQLQDAGSLAADEAEEWLLPLRELHNDAEFWQEQADSLLILLDAERLDIFRLDADLPEKTYVDANWDLVPLIDELSHDGQFHLLTFSPNKVRLFRTDGTRIAQLDPGDMPVNEDDLYEDRDHQTQLQFAGQGTDKVSYHGHGGDSHADDVQLERFARAVVDGLEERIPAPARQPLLLATVADNAPLLRSILNWDPVVEATIEGNPDHLDAGQLVEAGHEAITSWNARASEDLLGRVDDARSSRRAVFDSTEIAAFAEQGRLASVLVNRDSVDLAAPASDANYNQLNAIVVNTLANGGEAHFAPAELSEGLLGIARY